MARCGCGGSCSCSLTAGDNTSVTGTGTPANPWKVNALTDCAEVRNCISANQGVSYNPATGVLSACVSPNAGNGLTRDANGCLFVQLGAATVTTGCGLDGNGSPGDPLRAQTGAWPYACAIDANGGVVACDPATGQLYGEPRGHARMQSLFFDEDFPGLLVPAGNSQANTIRTISGSFTNPDPCRPAIVIASQEVEFDVDLPPDARVIYGFDGDETVNHTNRGGATEGNFAIQSTKVLNRGTIAPGATATYGFDARLGGGTNGARYNHLQGILRVLMISA